MRLKNKVYRFIALSLAFVVLCSSFSFSADIHYCQGNFKSMSFVGKAKTCHDMDAMAAMKNCKHHNSQAMDKSSCKKDANGCCDNKTFKYELDQDQQIQNADFVVKKQVEQFIVAFMYSFLTDLFVEKEIASCLAYKPPLIRKNISILFQSFLL